MKLAEILRSSNHTTLLELFTARVHTNSKRTLTVIADLVEKEFGIKQYPNSGGMCFLTQFIYSLSVASRIPAQYIADYFDKATGSSEGHSLSDLLDYFQNVEIVYKGVLHKFKLGFERYKSVNAAITAVKSGIPVTMITNINHIFYDKLENIRHDDKRDEIKHKGLISDFNSPNIKIENGHTFHALLLIGYDSKYDMVIGRDSRHDYGYKGYFRIKLDELRQTIKQFAFLSIKVEGIETSSTTAIEPKKFKDALKGYNFKIVDFNKKKVFVAYRDGLVNPLAMHNQFFDVYAFLLDDKVWINPIADNATLASLNKSLKRFKRLSDVEAEPIKTALTDNKLNIDITTIDTLKAQLKEKVKTITPKQLLKFEEDRNSYWGTVRRSLLAPNASDETVINSFLSYYPRININNIKLLPCSSLLIIGKTSVTYRDIKSGAVDVYFFNCDDSGKFIRRIVV